jgi:molybdopterin molybdotransferase
VPLLPLDDARALLLDAVEPLPPVGVPLAAARGLVLAGDVVAAEAVPPFDNTAMDGWAVRAADTAGASEAEPVVLRVVGTQPAGIDRGLQVGPGEVVRIMTGAPFPDGADAVVMVERSVAAPADADGAEQVGLTAEVAPGQHRRHAGDDVAVGDRVLDAGTVLGPPALGVLASVGLAEAVVHPRPRVGVLSTGDELVPPGRPLLPGQIRDSNRVVLLAQLEADGFEAVDLGAAPDDEAAVERALLEAAGTCDALCTSGGVSMGDFDPVKVVLARLAPEARWLQIAIKPAKPFAFAVLDGGGGRRVPVLGLPGNPVSSLVSYVLLARPALRRLAGAPAGPTTLAAVAGEPLGRHPDGKVHYVRVRSAVVDGVRVVRGSGGQGSHQLSALAHADALAVVPDGDGIAAGAPVEVIELG